MKNRSADLIDWNEAHSEGVGHSSSRYTLSFDHPRDNRAIGDDARLQWRVAVDGVTVCSAISVQDAFARTEALEALRCILQGRSDLISDQHWRGAELMAAEMADAATEALDRGALRAEDRQELQQNLEALQALSSAIRLESLKKQRESSAPAFPPLH
jgi:hypothetical protein